MNSLIPLESRFEKLIFKFALVTACISQLALIDRAEARPTVPAEIPCKIEISVYNSSGSRTVGKYSFKIPAVRTGKEKRTTFTPYVFDKLQFLVVDEPQRRKLKVAVYRGEIGNTLVDAELARPTDTLGENETTFGRPLLLGTAQVLSQRGWYEISCSGK